MSHVGHGYVYMCCGVWCGSDMVLHRVLVFCDGCWYCVLYILNFVFSGEAMGGLRHVTGYPDRPPVRVGISLGDAVASLYGVIGALMALTSDSRCTRRRCSVGRHRAPDKEMLRA